MDGFFFSRFIHVQFHTLNELRYVVIILQVLVAAWKMKQDPGAFDWTATTLGYR